MNNITTYKIRKKAADKDESHLTKAVEHQAGIAKCRAGKALMEANRLDALAKKIEIQAEAYAYKASVENDHAKTYEQQSKTISEAKEKYEAAFAEVEKESGTSPKMIQSPQRKTRAKTISVFTKEELEANEIRKKEAKIRLRKTILELKAACEAADLHQKHIRARDLAETQSEAKKIEASARREEAKAKRDEARARQSEEKAIRSGRTNEAEGFKRKALVHRARAIELESENREKYNQKRRKPQEKEIPRNSTIHSYSNGHKTQLRKKKHLSTEGLLNSVRTIFQQIPDPSSSKRTSKDPITLCDCLMSGLAIFGQKCPSLLQFDQDFRGDANGTATAHNLRSLYKITRVPSDTYMRERLDNIHPDQIRPVFKKLFSLMQRGKELESYAFLNGSYLVSGDGTGYFSSDRVHCTDCCKKQHKDGKVSYYHQMMSAAIVHPDHATVIPFCPEPIVNADGSTKNDCERNAAERLYRHIRREHPHLPLIITEDALGANGPHIRLLQELKMQFIIVVKPDGNKSIFEFLNGIERQEHTHSDKENSYKIQFVNDIPLNDAHHDVKVNFIEAWVTNHKTGDVYHNTWATDIPITMDNIFRLYQGGRAKWKIENETFNTLKNQGYNFEHNFGHGNAYLSTIFAFLMFAAFFIDQIQQSCCGLFQAALAKMKSKVRLWSKMRAYFMTLLIDSWEQLWQGIISGLQAAHLVPLTSLIQSDTPAPNSS